MQVGQHHGPHSPPAGLPGVAVVLARLVAARLGLDGLEASRLDRHVQTPPLPALGPGNKGTILKLSPLFICHQIRHQH